MPAVRVVERQKCGLDYADVQGISSLPDPIKPARELIKEIVRLGGWVCFWNASVDDAFDWGQANEHLIENSPYHYIDGTFQHAESTMWVARTLDDLSGESYDYAVEGASWLGLLGAPASPALAPPSLPFIPWPTQPEVLKHWDDRIWPEKITCIMLEFLVEHNEIVVVPGHESENVEVFSRASRDGVNRVIAFLDDLVRNDEWFVTNQERLIWDEEMARWELT